MRLMAPHAIRTPALREWSFRRRHLLVTILAGVALASGIALWVWTKGAERRALLRMPPTERAVLYQSTRATTESLCRRAETDSALRGRCFDSAELVREFPECDESCRSTMRQFTAQPAR